MKNTFIIGIGLFIVVICACIIGRRSYLNTTWEEYNTVLALQDKDISYRSRQLPLLGGGLLFYQVHFKDIPFPHTIDKMSLSISGDDIKIGLTGVRFSVDDALRAKSKDLITSLKNYTPYRDVFTKPLETLALVGVNDLQFNASFILKKDGLSRQVLGEIIDKKFGHVLFDFYIPSEMDKISPSELAQMPLLDGTFSFNNEELSNIYRAYATNLGYTEPMNWLTGVVIK